MEKKEYRVICSNVPFKDTIYVDIAPANGVTHEVMFESRQAKNPEVENLAGSVYLTQIGDNEPEIEYTIHKGVPRKSRMYDYFQRLYADLTPRILKTFKDMQDNGLSATLDVHWTQKPFDFYNMPKYATSLQEEKLMQETALRKKIESHKEATRQRMAEKTSKYSPQQLMAWKSAHTIGD